MNPTEEEEANEVIGTSFSDDAFDEEMTEPEKPTEEIDEEIEDITETLADMKPGMTLTLLNPEQPLAAAGSIMGMVGSIGGFSIGEPVKPEDGIVSEHTLDALEPLPPAQGVTVDPEGNVTINGVVMNTVKGFDPNVPMFDPDAPVAPPTDFEEDTIHVFDPSTLLTYMIEEQTNAVRHHMKTPILADWLDKGIRDTDLIYVTAKPGAGKTTLLCQIAVDFSDNGTPVCFMSGETPAAELAEERLWGLWGLQMILPKDTVAEKLLKASKVPKTPLYVPTWQGIREFRTKCIPFMDQMREHYGVKMFFFDHLRFFLNETDAAGNGIKEERLRFQDTSQCMRMYARDNKTTLFVAVQPSKTPADSDFQGSSMYGSVAMEQDANVIIQLARVLKKKKKGEELDEHFEPWTEMTMYKSRNGLSGMKRKVVINPVSKRIELYHSELNEVTEGDY